MRTLHVLFDTMVAILLFVDNINMLSKLGTCLQRLLNKLHEFCTSCSLEVNLSKTKIVIFGCNKRKSNHRHFT